MGFLLRGSANMYQAAISGCSQWAALDRSFSMVRLGIVPVDASLKPRIDFRDSERCKYMGIKGEIILPSRAVTPVHDRSYVKPYSYSHECMQQI